MQTTNTERKNSKNRISHLSNSNAEDKPENSHHSSLMEKLGIEENNIHIKKVAKNIIVNIMMADRSL